MGKFTNFLINWNDCNEAILIITNADADAVKMAIQDISACDFVTYEEVLTALDCLTDNGYIFKVLLSTNDSFEEDYFNELLECFVWESHGQINNMYY